MRYQNKLRTLFQLADTQQGYFTAKQAISLGFGANHHSHHVQKGNWLKKGWGVYRLVNYPHTDHPDLALMSFWSRNRQDEPEGVFSHETALSLYELSDLNPAQYHMSVPKHFRKSSETPKNLILHYTDLQETEIRPASGYRLTTLIRTLKDIYIDPTIPQEFVMQAIQEAINRGMVSLELLHKYDLYEPHQE